MLQLKNYRQTSLKARCDSVRQQELPKAYPVQGAPSNCGMTNTSAENRQGHALPAVEYVSDESLPAHKR